MEEIWQYIPQYKQRYAVSNLGRVKSYAQTLEGRFIRGSTDHKGYRVVRLYDEHGCAKDYKVHRLVSSAFCVNSTGGTQVNHRDENKDNNCFENLEWCDAAYNNRYGTKSQRAGMSNRCHVSTSSKVYSVDQAGRIFEYDSIGEAERQTGLSHSNIVRTLKGRSHTCGGRKWYYLKS